MGTDTDTLLHNREKTHGSFKDGALVAQRLHDIVFPHRLSHYNARQTQALRMIITKLSRIVTGDARFPDHWADIAGYAELAREACQNEPIPEPLQSIK